MLHHKPCVCVCVCGLAVLMCGEVSVQCCTTSHMCGLTVVPCGCDQLCMEIWLACGCKTVSIHVNLHVLSCTHNEIHVLISIIMYIINMYISLFVPNFYRPNTIQRDYFFTSCYYGMFEVLAIHTVLIH